MKRLMLGVLGVLALAGCGGGGGGGGSSSSTKARIAFVNASPDAGNVDFLLDGDEKANAVAYNGLTAFSDYSPSAYDVSTRTDGDTEILWSEQNDFNADQDSLVAAVGLKNPGTELEKRLVLSFGTVDRTAPNGNKARLVIVHGFVRKVGFDTPSIDFRNPGNTPVVNSTNIAFGEMRSLDVDSGSQTFQIRQNGTEQVFIEKTLNLAPGKIYLALISGQEDAAAPAAPDLQLVEIPAR